MGEFDLLPPWLAHLAPLSGSAAADPSTFPTTPLRVKVEVAQGADVTALPSTWVWADATTITYAREDITIKRGRADEASTADSSQLSMTVDNRGGHWSTRHPNSPWYGLVRKGSPVRVSVEGYPRFSGFLAELPPRWDLSGNDRYAPVVARGLLYRLARGASPERSALRRTIGTADPVAYWPLEDDAASTVGASAVGGSTMSATAEVIFAGFAGPAGTLPAPDLGDSGRLSATVTASTATAYTVEFVTQYDSSGTAIPLAVRLTGGSFRYFWVYTQFTGFAVAQLIAGDTAASTTIFGDYPTTDLDEWHHYRFLIKQDGANITARVWLDGAEGTSISSAGTLGHIVGVDANSALTSSTISGAVAHVAVYDGEMLDDHSDALLAYVGEQAHVRAARLCAEEGIPFSTDVTESQAMGPQGVSSVVPLLRECEATDQAYLYEGFNFDLIFQGNAQRRNMPVSLQLDYDDRDRSLSMMEPTDDDQAALNDVEVTRDGGSSSRLTETSALVELSIPNIGRRDDSQTYSLYTDDQTAQLAGWRLHNGTWPGYRYPGLTLDLAATPDLIGDFCLAGLAFRAAISNPPDDVGPDEPDVIVEGYTETIGHPIDWDIQANCSPYGPWNVHVLATDGTDPNPLVGRDDWDTCAVAVDSGATITVTVSPLITTTAAEFPLNITIAGEDITVTACAGGSSPQTLTCTRSVNGIVKTHPAGTPVTLADALVLTL